MFMPRPISDDKRSALIAAAIRIIVAQGLSAPTAGIAKEAGVANGSLFTYFETKFDLFNAVYLELKFEMAFIAMKNVAKRKDLREQVLHTWQNWMNWALSFPEKRKALAQPGVSDDVTPATRTMANKALADVAELLERVRAIGPMRETPMSFVLTLMNSVAETTIDFMAQNPAIQIANQPR